MIKWSFYHAALGANRAQVDVFSRDCYIGQAPPAMEQRAGPPKVPLRLLRQDLA
jgi:hypothetical protein